MAYDIFNNYDFADIDDNASLTDLEAPEWKKVAVKTVQDSDGFATEYTWYTNGDIHIFMFGDSDIVEPDEDYADWVCENEETAQEWFSTYEGFTDIEDDNEFEFLDENLLQESYGNFPSWLIDFLDSSRDGKTIKKLLNNRHVDLHNATYVKAPFPRSNRDPILKDESKIKIFKLMDGQYETIYIVGINNPYVKRPHTYEHRYVNDMPMKDILDMAIEFGYIDMNDDNNKNTNIHTYRRNLAYSLRDITRNLEKGQHPVYHHTYGHKEGRTDWNNILSTSVEWVTDKGYDKSGYKLDPDKYRKMLNNVGLDTYGMRLQSFYNKIESVRSKIIELITSVEVDTSDAYVPRSMFSNNKFADIADATESLSRAIDSYKRIKDACAEILESRGELTSAEAIEEINRRIKWAFGYDADSFNEYITDARNTLKHLETTSTDK